MNTKRVFDFYPLEDRVLLSGESADAADVGASADADLAALLLESLAAADGQANSEPAVGSLAESSDERQSQLGGDADLADASAVDPAESLEVIFVDARVQDSESLLGGLQDQQSSSSQWLVVHIDGDQDGIELISSTLGGLSGVDAVHLISHSDGDGIQLGATRLDLNSVEGYAGEIAVWADSLDVDADLLIYGCDLASTADGRALLDSLRALCDCDVAASDDATGHQSLGGDWDLEYTIGQVDSAVAFTTDIQQGWMHLMAVETVRDEFNSVGYSGNDGTQNWAGDWQELGESDGANTGLVEGDANPAGLEIGRVNGPADINGLGLKREADLSQALSATLSLDAWVSSYDDDASVSLAISTDNVNWTILDTYDFSSMPTTSTAYNYDISGYLSASTWIRFLGSGDTGSDATNDEFYADNIQIAYTTNTAPTLAGANNLASISEDQTGNGGTLVSALIAGQISDPDPGALTGIAVTGVDDSNGTWEYTTDGGGNWHALDSVSENSARLLASDANTYVRFVPNANWNGTVNSGLTFHAWDQTEGTAGSTMDLYATESVRDEFSVASFSGNDGSVDWATDWQQLGEADGPSSGSVRVDTTPASLEIGSFGLADTTGLGLQRQVDLSGATSATLSLDAWRAGFDNNASITLAVSTDGSSWTDLDTFTYASAPTSATSFDYDISAYASSTTWIRFLGSGLIDGDFLRFDDVQIEYTALNTGGESSISTDAHTAGVVVNPVNDAPEIATWYDNNWLYRKEIIVDAGQVAGDLTSFPILIGLDSDAELAAFAQADGDDILFTSADGTTQLAHEIEVFTSATGELVAWVRTDLSSAEDTRLYMYYGNSAAANQQDVTNVWDSDYQAVWHLSDAPTGAAGEINDSTSNNNHGTSEGSMDGADLVSTQVGTGLDFDGADDLIRVSDSPGLDSTASAATFELWINWQNAVDGDHQIVMTSSNRFTGGAQDGYEWASQGDRDHFYYPEGGTDPNYVLGPNPYTNGTWHHVAVTQDFATRTVEIYIDGVAMPTTTDTLSATWTTLANPDDWLWGGNPDRATRYFDGMMDEIRVSSVVRSQAWIQTSLASQSDPGTFFTLGSAESQTLTLTDINEDNITSPGDTVASLIASVGGDRITDVDAGALEGIAVVSVDDSNGTWQYDAGSGWTNFGSVSDNAAVLLDPTASLRFVPDADYNGTSGDITFRAWDQSDGNPSGASGVDVSANGGVTAYSAVTDSARLQVMAVNDSPAVATNTGTTVNEGSSGNVITTAMLNEGDVDDDGAELIYTITDLADNGTMFLAGFGALGLNDTFTQADLDAGNVTYDHDDSETTSDSFDFSLADSGEDGATSASGTFNIGITPVNDNSITAISDTDPASESISENAISGTPVGVTAFASDDDAGDTVSYSLDDNDGGRFAIDSATGFVTVAGAIDRETDGPSRSLTVRATSTDGSFTTRTFVVAVNDVDEFDVGPVSDVDGTVNAVNESATAGTPVGITASASDADATTNTITYSLQDDDGGRFTIDSATGIVTVAGAIDRETDGPTRNITVRATSADGSFTDQAFAISINDVDEFDVGAVSRR